MGQKNRNVLLWISFFMDICINLSTLYFVYMFIDVCPKSIIGKTQMAVSLIVVFATSLIYFMFSIYTIKASEKLRKVLLKTITAHVVSFFIVTLLIMIFSPEKRSFFKGNDT